MRILKILFCLLLSFSLSKQGEGQLLQAQISIQGGEGIGLTASNDGGYCITGATDSVPYNQSGIYVVKLDLNGTIQWSKVIDGGAPFSDDYGSSIIQARDKGYAIAGSTNTFDINHNNKVCIIKLDSAGNLKWTQMIGGMGNEEGYSIVEADDGGYVVAGTENEYIPGGVYVVKVNAGGNLEWAKTYGDSTQTGEYIVKTRDKGYAVVGTHAYGNYLHDQRNIYVIKIDSNGNLKWSRTVGGKIRDLGWQITQISDGSLVVAGETQSYGDTTNGDMYVFKLDSAGNLKWAEAIGGPKGDAGWAIASTYDSGCIVAGSTMSYGDTINGKSYVVKLNSQGHLEWTRALGPPGSNGQSIVQTKDSGYAIVVAISINETLLLKLDKYGHTCSKYDSGGIVTLGGIIDSGGMMGNGGDTLRGGGVNNVGSIETKECIVTGVYSPVLQNRIGLSVYPNPNNGLFHIDIKGKDQETGTLQIEIYNVLGQRVYFSSLSPSQMFNNEINISDNPAGIYFYRVLQQNGALIGSGKVTIQK